MSLFVFVTHTHTHTHTHIDTDARGQGERKREKLTLSVPPPRQDVTERERTASWLTQLFLWISEFSQPNRIDFSSFLSALQPSTHSHRRGMSQLKESQSAAVCMKNKRCATILHAYARCIYFFHSPSGDKSVQFWACWLYLICHLAVGGNNAPQPAHNFFYHAFFSEGHFEVRVAATISAAAAAAAAAPVYLLLRSLWRAVTAGSFPK